MVNFIYVFDISLEITPASWWKFLRNSLWFVSFFLFEAAVVRCSVKDLFWKISPNQKVSTDSVVSSCRQSASNFIETEPGAVVLLWTFQKSFKIVFLQNTSGSTCRKLTVQVTIIQQASSTSDILQKLVMRFVKDTS